MARRPAHTSTARALPLHAVTDGRVPLVKPSFFLSLRDTDGEVPPVSFFFNTHDGSATAPAAVGEGLGPRARAQRLRLSLAILLLSPKRALLSPFHLGHANGGRPPLLTIDRPLGLGRAQTSKSGRFEQKQGAWCSPHHGGRSNGMLWRWWRCHRAGAPATARSFR